MTLQAIRFLMFSNQGKPGFIMVEEDLLPVLDRVTLRTFRSENSLVPVHFFMAFNAGLGCVA